MFKVILNIIFIIYILANIYISIFNPYKLLDKMGKYTTLIGVSIGFFILFLYTCTQETLLSQFFSLFIYLVSIIILYLIVFYIYYFFTSNTLTHKLFTYFTNGLILLGGLSIIYVIFLKNINTDKIPIYNKIIYNLIFYIPCIYIDIVTFIKKEFNISSNVSKILLLLEGIFILLRLAIPIIFTKVLLRDGLVLLNKPVYLNQSNSIINVNKLNKKFNKKKIYDYSLSFWMTIDNQPPNTSDAYVKYTTLLNFGKKPTLQYNAFEDTLKINMLNGKSTNVVLKTNKILYQKWNHFVINYNRGTLDIFVNNKLVSTNKNVVPYLESDSIEIGQNDGIHGGICNFVFFDKSISKTKINSIYKYYKNNPCINY